MRRALRCKQVGSLRAKIILGLFLCMLTALVVAVIVASHTEPLDALTQCPVQRPVENIVLLVIDQSNQFEDADRARTRAMIGGALASLDYPDKLVAIEPNVLRHYEPTVLFERCAPKNAARVNPLFDKVQAAKDATDSFRNAFWSSVEKALTQVDAPKSPLLETLAYMSQRPDYIVARRRSIHVYSDLIQYSDVADFYKAVPSPEGADSRLRAVPSDFRGASVFLAQVARRNIWESRPKVAEFWDAWLKAHGATPRWDPESVY